MELSVTQKLILELIADGCGSEDIAAEIKKPAYWVRRQRSKILDTMGADTTEQAVAMGFRRGILR